MTWLAAALALSVLLVLAAEPWEGEPTRGHWWQGNGRKESGEMPGIRWHPGDRRGAVSWYVDRGLCPDARVSKCRSRSQSVVTMRGEWGVSGDTRQGRRLWDSDQRLEAGAVRWETEILRGWDPRRDWGDQGDAETRAERLHLLYYHWPDPECWPIRGQGWGRVGQWEAGRGRQLPALILSMMKRAESRERHQGCHGRPQGEISLHVCQMWREILGGKYVLSMISKHSVVLYCNSVGQSSFPPLLSPRGCDSVYEWWSPAHRRLSPAQAAGSRDLNTGSWLAELDHVTCILGSDWSRRSTSKVRGNQNQ